MTNRQECKVLLLGETGSGKSTFINMLYNYFRDGTFDNPRVAIPSPFAKQTETDAPKLTERANVAKDQSQTDASVAHALKKGSDAFVWIDTPGLSDTRGPEQDDKNLADILTFAENAGYLSSIVLIVNGANPRLTVNMQNVLVRLRGCLPDVLLGNIILVLTNCTSDACNFEISSATINGTPPRAVFHMQNSLFSSDRSRWDAKALRRQRDSFDDSVETIGEIVTKIKNLTPTTTAAFSKMRENRNRIKSELASAIAELDKAQKIEDMLQAENAKKAGINPDLYKNFVQQETIEVTELVDAPYHSTMCSRCSHVCHESCGLNFISSAGSSEFMGCACFGGSNSCNSCPGRCPHSSHFHDRKKYRKVTKTAEKILHDLKQKYDDAVDAVKQADLNITQHQKDLAAVKAVVAQKQSEIRTLCSELKTICRGFNFVDELAAVVSTLETRGRTLTSTSARDENDKLVENIKKMADNLTEPDSPSAKK